MCGLRIALNVPLTGNRCLQRFLLAGKTVYSTICLSMYAECIHVKKVSAVLYAVYYSKQVLKKETTAAVGVMKVVSMPKIQGHQHL